MTDAAALRGGPIAAAIRAHRLIVVLRRVEPRSRLLDLVDELVDAGARIFEVTLDAAGAADDLQALRDHLAGRGCLVGAGTILRSDQVGAATSAGADFGVAPLLDGVLVRAAIDAGLPFVPAALTPTEIHAAWSAGATFVKLFPASAVGPSFVRELHGPMPEIELIATGGVDAGSGAAFLEAGAVAVGLGGSLTRAPAPERRATVRRLVAG